MHVGGGTGESIPAGIRNRVNWVTGKPSILHWGDATLYLGWYLGVLATEYHLLNTNRQDTEEVLDELGYAISAVERLDSVAELQWNYPPEINGFLLRDDVPADFLSLHPHLNHNLDETLAFNSSGDPAFVTEISSDFITDHNAMSQDQIVHLLMGLSLVVKLLPDESLLENKNFHKNITIKSKAIKIINNIIDYSSNKNGKAPWQLRYPGGDIIPNTRGGDLRANASGIAQTGKIFGNNRKGFLVSIPYNFIWQMQQSLAALRHNISSLHMALVTAAVSDYWRGPLGQNTTEQGINFQGRYPSGRYLWIDYHYNNYGWDIFYNYLRITLHDYNKTDYERSIDIINSAPYQGPYYHLENKKPADGWAGSRRFIDTPPRQTEGSIHFPGNYNGLDFMLFFNLYHIADEKANFDDYKKPNNFNFDF